MSTLQGRREPVNGGAARREKLFFGRGNAKLDEAIHVFSLPAGWSCPFAKECHSRADRESGHITDGRHVIYRCYAASMEARRSSVRDSRWRNYEMLKRARTKDRIVRLILDSLSPHAGVVRVHDSGDYYSQPYYDAWIEVARQRPRTLFYSYLKALPFWARRLQEVGDGHEPGAVANFVMTASCGGARDELIERLGLRFAMVVNSEEEARERWLELDHTDELAMKHGDDFALLIHGTQPPDSEAMRAVTKLRKEGWAGYGKTSRRVGLQLV